MSALSPTAAYFGNRSPLSPSSPLSGASPVRIRSYSSFACYEEESDSNTASPVPPAGHVPRHLSDGFACSPQLRHAATVRYGRSHSARSSPYCSTRIAPSFGYSPRLSLAVDDSDGNSCQSPYEVTIGPLELLLLPHRHLSLVGNSHARSHRSGSSGLNQFRRLKIGPLSLRRRDMHALPQRLAGVAAARCELPRSLPTSSHRAPPLMLVGHAGSEASPTFHDGPATPRERTLECSTGIAVRRHSDRSGSVTATLSRRKLPVVPRQAEIADSSEDDGRPRAFEDFLQYGRVSDETIGAKSATRATSVHSCDDANFLNVSPVSYRKTSENNLAISHYRNDSNDSRSSNNNKRKNHKKKVTSFDFSLFNNFKNNNCGDDNRSRASFLSNYNTMSPPPRSQSFRHRTRPMTFGGAVAAAATSTGGGDARRAPLSELGERRRSTPTIHRRNSLHQKTRTAADRTDVWPEPKQMSELEERFRRLPDSEDYTRVRQFKIDSKGAVVSRGDSFRRKRHVNVNQRRSCNFDNTVFKADSSLSPFPISDTDSIRTGRQTLLIGGDRNTGGMSVGGTSDSRSTSVSSNDSTGIANKVAKSSLPSAGVVRDGIWDGVVLLPTTDEGSFVIEDAPSTSTASYKVYVVGQSGAGKSALIRQFISSEYRNAFADEIEEMCNATAVSVNIGGFECELNFFEFDSNMDPFRIEEPVAAYLLVYSIDQKSSFRTVVNALETIRSKRKSVPVIIAGNKIDLERKRAVFAHEVKCVALTYDVVNFEISVALNHDVDDLLVGIVAEVKESVGTLDKRKSSSASGKRSGGTAAKNSVKLNDENSATLFSNAGRSDSAPEPEEFRAAIRRFSQRKKRQMGAGGGELEGGKCTNLSPVSLFEKFRQWRRGMSKC